MIARLTTRWRAFRRWFSRPEWAVRLLNLPRSDVPREQDGLILIQIDGLSRPELERAIQCGKMPFLRTLLDQESYQILSLYSGMPSSTPAVQGELFYGVKTAVPAFEFVDHESGHTSRMFSPETAAKTQARIQQESDGLLEGGSSYCNIYSGGAKESHFCAASIGWSQLIQAAKPSRLAFLLLWHGASIVKAFGLAFLEWWIALFDFVRRASTGRELVQEFLMIASRVVVAIGLRELTIISASMDTARGLPIIHLNLLGYDEHAHRRGPASTFARWTLKGIDRSISHLVAASRLSDQRDYDIWIYSDHGQETTLPYSYLTGQSITAACNAAVSQVHVESEAPRKKAWQQPTSRASWLSTGTWVARLFGEELPESGSCTSAARVAACGPLGLFYTPDPLSHLERIRIANHLVAQQQVPMVFITRGTRDIIAINERGSFDLPRQARDVFGDDHPFVEMIADDLVALCHHPDAGEMVLSGWTLGKPPISLAVQAGAHAGPGPMETHGFALLPKDAPLHSSFWNGSRSLRPLNLRSAALAFRKGMTFPPSSDTTQPLPDVVSPTASRWRAMTYNVHSCRGMDGVVSPRRIARVIAQCDADIVALQELDVGRSRTGHVDQAHEIARYLSMDHHFHPVIHVEEEQYGDAILSRLPMKLIRTGELPQTKAKRERRGALWVELAGSREQRLQVLNTHLSLFPIERRRQAECLLEEPWVASAIRSGPTLLCGDFNATPASATCRLFSKSLRDAHSIAPGPTSSTWFSAKPITRIDHVYCSVDLHVHSAHVVDNELARLASDHLPLVVDFSFPHAV